MYDIFIYQISSTVDHLSRKLFIFKSIRNKSIRSVLHQLSELFEIYLVLLNDPRIFETNAILSQKCDKILIQLLSTCIDNFRRERVDEIIFE